MYSDYQWIAALLIVMIILKNSQIHYLLAHNAQDSVLADSEHEW